MFKFSRRQSFIFILIITTYFMNVSNVFGWGDVNLKPMEFPVEYSENDPYEIVLTAEKYRSELNKEQTPEALRKIYFENASNLYERALLLDPNYTYGYISYAYTQLFYSKFMEDKNYYYNNVNMLISKTEQDNYWTKLLRGQINCLDENWDKAKIYLDQAAAPESGGKVSTVNAWLGYTYAALKDDNKAQTHYQKTVSANTDYESVRWANEISGKSGKPRQMPPLVPPASPRKGIQPVSIKMRLRVAPFEDTTGAMGNMAAVFSSLLSTALFNSDRFNMIEVNKAIGDPKDYENMIDAVLTGSIIKVNQDSYQFIMNLKATHPATGNLLLAMDLPISYSKSAGQIQFADIEVNKVADMIERKLARGEGKVVSIDGKKLIVSLGSESGVKSGFTAVIVGKNEQTVKNPLSGEVIGRDIYLGEIVFERVEEKYSTARLITPGRIFVRVGDIIRLK